MSFLDNLENNLKALERQDEKDPEKLKREHERREAERTAALLRAPHVETLKNSQFTMDLLAQCRAIGHGQRVLVRFTWLGETLRLDAKAKRMELVPTPEGIISIFSVDGQEMGRTSVHPQIDDPSTLAQRWLLESVA